jgi:adenine C2-methylase RlmN of 23S rRNA A2503 and tRNA A37
MDKKDNLFPVGKYVNKHGQEGIRYVWMIDGKKDYYVESGSFPRRTKLGKGTLDEDVAAYTTSVSLGCILSSMNSQCKFCVTGNKIPFYRLLTAEEIALQNVFMAIDDDWANSRGLTREFAYMGQGEPGFSYNRVKKAIILTDKIMSYLGIKTYRHIFATSGVPSAIKKITKDLKSGDYGKTNILLHLSVHALKSRDKLMPINKIFPIEKVLTASDNYSKLTGEKVVINLMMLKNAKLMGGGPFTNISIDEFKNLNKFLNPEHHRIIFCEYNCGHNLGKNGKIYMKEMERLSKSFKDYGFSVKRFIAFGRKNNLACGLLGGQAIPNFPPKKSGPSYIKALKLINKFSKN